MSVWFNIFNVDFRGTNFRKLVYNTFLISNVVSLNLKFKSFQCESDDVLVYFKKKLSLWEYSCFLSYLPRKFHIAYRIKCTLVESLWCRHKYYGIMLDSGANCSSITKTIFVFDSLRASKARRNEKEIIHHIQNGIKFIWLCT